MAGPPFAPFTGELFRAAQKREIFWSEVAWSSMAPSPLIGLGRRPEVDKPPSDQFTGELL